MLTINNCVMSRICPITWKKPSVGNNVSHSKRRTKRKFLPNLVSKKIYDPVTKRFVKMKISTKALRTLTKQMRLSS